MGRPGRYIFRPPNSTVWHIRFQYPASEPGGKRQKVEYSLGTRDKEAAVLKSLPRIKSHLIYLREMREERNPLAERRPTFVTRRIHPDGLHTMSDGRQIVATGDLLIVIGADGVPIQGSNLETIEQPGGGMTQAAYEAAIESDTLFEGVLGEEYAPGWKDAPALEAPRPTKPKRGSADDEHLERWIKHRGISGYLETEARSAWATFRELTEGKSLKECDRDDGRKLADYYFATGNVSASVRKKVGHLCAAVELAMHKGKLTFNPFSRVVEARKDATPRCPMPDEYMDLVRANLDKLKPEERLLWVILATTGMRRGEAVSIDKDHVEKGIRYVFVGTKTKASTRRVPLPDAVLELLPQRIEGPIFAKEAKNLGRNLLRAIRRLGVPEKHAGLRPSRRHVTGQAKEELALVDLHSLRHRAKDRLRAEDVIPEVQDWILGHDEMTVSVGYGVGPSMTKLKPIIEMIGY